MSDIVQIFDEQVEAPDVVGSSEFTMESVRSVVKQMNEIDEEIKDLRENKKTLVQDFLDEYNVPKKEVATAIRMLKSDIDPGVTVDIYANIADLIE